MGLSKTLIYLVFKGVSIEFTLLILKYKYWFIVVNPHFPDATPIMLIKFLKRKRLKNIFIFIVNVL